MGNKALVALVVEFPTYARRYLVRKVRRFNVVPRAEKQIDKILQDKPQRAPLYDDTSREIEKFLKENPDGLKKFSEKDEKLQKTLENVYVKSKGDNKDGFSMVRVDSSMEKRLQLQNVTEETVPCGKYTIKRAEEFLFAYNKDSKEFSPSVLSAMYGINEIAMKNILDHVKVCKVVLPDVKRNKLSSIKKLGLGISPPEMIEEPTITKFIQNLTVREATIMNPFHKKLKRPPHEQLEAGKSSARKVFEESIQGALMLSEDTRKLLEENEKLLSKTRNVVKPEDVDIDIYKLVADKKAEELKKSRMEMPEGGTAPKIVKPEHIEFDVFKAVESAEAVESNQAVKSAESDRDSSVESKKSPAASEQPLKASDKV